MSKKFKIDEHVRVKATGEIGVVKGREIVPVGTDKKIRVEYVVKTDEGFDNWKVYAKNDLEKIHEKTEEARVYTKIYDVVDGYKIMMYSKVDNFKYGDVLAGLSEYVDEEDLPVRTGRLLTMGYAIYNPSDEYNPEFGFRIARKRARTSPFCSMTSLFNGEFNGATVNALMDVKADYIKNNFDRFIKRAAKR